MITAILANSTAYAAPTLTSGALDRPFSDARTLYYVEIPNDTIPEITMDGFDVIQQAIRPYTNDALTAENTTILANETGTIKYRFVFEKKGGTINITNEDVSISADGVLSVQGNVGSLKNIKIIIMKPTAQFSEEYFKYEDISDKLNLQSKALDVVDVDAADINGQGLTYQFPTDAISGQYGILITADGINSSYFSGYYMSNIDMQNAIKSVNVKAKLSDVNTPDLLKNYIEQNSKPLYLDMTYYNQLLDDYDPTSNPTELGRIIAIKAMKLETDENYGEVDNNGDIIDPTVALNEIAKAFYKGVAVAWINQGKSVSQILAQYNKYLQLEMYDKYITLTNTADVDSKVKAEKTEDGLRKAFNSMVAVSLINKAEPADITKLITENKDYLEIETDLYNYFINNEDKCIKAFRNKTFVDAKDIEDAIKDVKDTPKEDNKDTSVNSRPSSNGGMTVPILQSKNDIVITPSTPDSENTENKKLINLPFTDIGDVEWAHIAIDHLYNNKILNGKSETLFCPNDYITREEFVKLIVNAFYLEEGTDIKFVDVPEDAWYTDYVKIAFKNKIITGISETEFGVGQHITREDIAVMIYRAVKQTGLELDIIVNNIPKLSDLGEVKAYAVEAVNFMINKGAVNGIDGRFKPADKATRAQTAQMLYQIIKIR